MDNDKNVVKAFLNFVHLCESENEMKRELLLVELVKKIFKLVILWKPSRQKAIYFVILSISDK